MIDFHCHILPGIDDGAANWEESIEMARFLAEQQIKAVAATPHYIEGYYTPAAAEIRDKTKELQERLDSEGIDLRVYPGCEALISPDLPDLVREGRVLTVNDRGRYLLVELPIKGTPLYTDDVLFRLKLRGVTPIIAHPERNSDIAADPGRLAALIGKGCLVQLDIGSLLGLYGQQTRKAAETISARKMVHFFGSDLHGTGDKAVPVCNAAAALLQKCGPHVFHQVTQTSPDLALAGSPVTLGEPEEEAVVEGPWKRMLRKMLG